MKKAKGITYEEIELVRTSYCDGCEGARTLHDTGCYENCEGFIKEYNFQKRERTRVSGNL